MAEENNGISKSDIRTTAYVVGGLFGIIILAKFIRRRKKTKKKFGKDEE